MPSTVPPNVAEWLDRFAASVRSQDQVAGAGLVASEAVGFGSVVAVYRSRDDLMAGQWSKVWSRTTGFRFDEVIGCWSHPDGSITVAALWSSKDADSAADRRGRATLVLTDIDDRLEAVHTHFSMAPGTIG